MIPTDETPVPSGKSPELLVRSQHPFNAEPLSGQLAQHDLTPSSHFFVRTHGPVPEIDPFGYRLSVEGLVQRSLSLSLHDLRTGFSRVSVVAVLACAGNRRRELMEVAKIPDEIEWDVAAVGNARWTGAPLREVLDAAGLDAGATHIAFEGLEDTSADAPSPAFGSSIPLEKALSSEVLLAYEMNDAPLLPSHGFPLRVVVPGYIGARSVKWLGNIRAQAEPTHNYYQRESYRLFPTHITPSAATPYDSLILQDFPINSVICDPAQGASRTPGLVTVRGYALVGGGRYVERVEVTADSGQSWTIADLVGPHERWGWRLWEARLHLPSGVHRLAVRAWDSAANTQPEDPAKIWNFKGYMNNAWHTVVLLVGS